MSELRWRGVLFSRAKVGHFIVIIQGRSIIIRWVLSFMGVCWEIIPLFCWLPLQYHHRLQQTWAKVLIWFFIFVDSWWQGWGDDWRLWVLVRASDWIFGRCVSLIRSCRCSWTRGRRGFFIFGGSGCLTISLFCCFCYFCCWFRIWCGNGSCFCFSFISKKIIIERDSDCLCDSMGFVAKAGGHRVRKFYHFWKFRSWSLLVIAIKNRFIFLCLFCFLQICCRWIVILIFIIVMALRKC